LPAASRLANSGSKPRARFAEHLSVGSEGVAITVVRAFLRVATLHQVLKVTPLDSATQRATAAEGGHNWGLWEFDREAVGEIGGQSSVPPHSLRQVRDLHQERLAWVIGITDEREKHQSLLADFVKGDFLDPPVLIHYPTHGWHYQIRDGAHRVHAAYEHLATAPERRLRVYWNRLAWPLTATLEHRSPEALASRLFVAPEAFDFSNLELLENSAIEGATGPNATESESRDPGKAAGR
jgi:hypothetical protein